MMARKDTPKIWLRSGASALLTKKETSVETLRAREEEREQPQVVSEEI